MSGTALTRGMAMGVNGAIATPHYLASAVGFRVLQEDGNALDAAIAANAILGLVRADQCSIGGDLFLLIWPARESRVLCLNASGSAGALATPDFVRAAGHAAMPDKGPLSVVVPGCVAGWAAALDRFGTRPLADLLQPAIALAEGGFPVVPLLASRARDETVHFNEAAWATFAPQGSVPAPGDVLRLPDYAASLRTIAREGPRAMYDGPLGQRIGSFLQEVGGHLTPADLAAFEPEWVEPAHMACADFDVHVVPPNSQAMLHLLALGILDGVDLGGPLSAQSVHLQVQAARLAYQDRWQIADPRVVPVPTAQLLSADHTARRRAELLSDPPRRRPLPPPAGSADTVYIAATDRDGNVVSMIQSVRKAFGSGLVVPGTGILLNDRGRDFGLEDGDPNQIAPGKRSRHTLTPAMALREGKPVLAYGTAGGDVQPFTMLQLSCDLLRFGMDPQAAVDAPRWTILPSDPPRGSSLDWGGAVGLEARFAATVPPELEAMGYRVTLLPEFEIEPNIGSVAAAIRIDRERGIIQAGADPRADGIALAY